MNEETNLEELKDYVEGIHELIEDNKKDMHFLQEVLFQVREMENRVLFHRRQYFKPQPNQINEQ